MKLLIAAGGTGGHLFPGIAVAQFLKKVDPQSEVVFVGSERGLEGEILAQNGFSHESLRIGRIKGEGWMEKIKTVMRLPKALKEARQILTRHQPDVAFGIGGYSSGPMILAAFLKRIPRAILEPNAIPGFTNRILGRFVNRIFVAFPETERFFSKKKVTWTGTPVRKELSDVGADPRVGPRQGEHMGSPLRVEKPFTIVVLGGSQGAKSLNEAMVDLLPTLKQSGRPFRIIHQAGARDVDWVKKAYEGCGLNFSVEAFIQNMSSAYKDADLVVSRAGASTIAEILETHSPSILVPYPFAADNHQRFNALSLVEEGAAEMMMDGELKNNLGKRILSHEKDRSILIKMRENLVRLRKVPAAEMIARECLDLCRGAIYGARA